MASSHPQQIVDILALYSLENKMLQKWIRQELRIRKQQLTLHRQQQMLANQFR